MSEDVLDDVKSISTPPSNLATSYCSMYAFNNHLRVTSAKIHLSTSDLGVVATFQQECLSHLNDQNLTMASLKYVGWIKEISELDYGQFQTVVLFCNWVVANYEGPNATIKCDGYGFTLVNFECFILMST